MKSLYKSITACGALLTAISVFTSCDDEKIYDLNHPEAEVIGAITFDYEGILPMGLGTTLSLKMSADPDKLEDDVIYATTDESVAYVDQYGILHCVGIGEAVVSAMPSVGFGATARLTVNVIENVVYTESITITGVKELPEFHYMGDEFQLTTLHYPENSTYNFVEWSTSNPKIATVDKEGNVVCGEVGSAVIIAKTLAPDATGKVAKFELTVSPSADVESIVISPYTELICLEKPFDLDVAYYPAYGNPATVEWESSDESVAYVGKGGHVIPTGFGTVTLTGVCPNGNDASINITVTPGLHIWDPSNRFTRWIAATAGTTIEYTEDYLINHMVVSGSNYRADIKIDCNDNNPVVFNFGEYPVIALRTTIPPDGRNTFDVVDVNGTGGGNPQCNIGEKASGTPYMLEDGSYLVYVDWSTRTQYPLSGNVSFKTFQLKVADMPVATTTEDTYKVYWIRTFKSVEDMIEFAEKQVADGN
ncbi:MAG: DUF4979 domain-containing protein [Muribaculaceae bacterium]|nr:DUF4979 domain-containing protein [Muribaculaceae bacterium]